MGEFEWPPGRAISRARSTRKDQREGTANRLAKLTPRMATRWVTEIVQALSEQTVVVPDTPAASLVLPRLAQQLASLRRQRDGIGKEVERLVLAHLLIRS